MGQSGTFTACQLTVTCVAGTSACWSLALTGQHWGAEGFCPLKGNWEEVSCALCLLSYPVELQKHKGAADGKRRVLSKPRVSALFSGGDTPAGVTGLRPCALPSYSQCSFSLGLVVYRRQTNRTCWVKLDQKNLCLPLSVLWVPKYNSKLLSSYLNTHSNKEPSVVSSFARQGLQPGVFTAASYVPGEKVKIRNSHGFLRVGINYAGASSRGEG